MPRSRSFWRNERGVSALEFALTALPFLMLLVGTIELGRLLWMRQAMQSLAGSAARCMGVLQTQCAASGVYSPTGTANFVIVGAAAFVVQPTMGNSQSAPRLQFSQTALPVLPVQVFGKTA